MLFVILASLLVCLVQSQEVDWNYDDSSQFGPSSWSQSYPACGGPNQSPINIRSSDVVSGITLPPITYVNYDILPSFPFTLKNIGHGVQINIPDRSFTFTGPGLRGSYTLEQMHFHWSQSNTEGSEHRVESSGHSMEIHMVHYDATRYSSVSEAAAADPQGVAVLAIFVDVDDSSSELNEALGRLTTHLSAITNEDQTTTMAPFALQDLLPRIKEYYRYQGSLTTPACSESLVWSVFRNSIYITQSQMNSFRTIHGRDGEVLEKNTRPVQALNGREIYGGV